MSDITIDIIIPIVTAIVGAVVGTLIQNLISSEKKETLINSANNIQILNFTEIHIKQNEVKEQKNPNKQKERKSNSETDGDIWLYFGGILFAGLVLIYLYLKYQREIHNSILLGTIFVVSICLSAVFVIIKKKIEFDGKFKITILWIAFSIIVVPIELYLLKNPIYFNTLDKGAILAIMRNDGLVALFGQGSGTFGFLLYQAIGVLLIFSFILHLLTGNLHIWSMINLSLNSRANFIWRFFYKITYPLCSSPKFFIGFSVFLLVLSFCFVSGIFANLIG